MVNTPENKKGGQEADKDLLRCIKILDSVCIEILVLKDLFGGIN